MPKKQSLEEIKQWMADQYVKNKLPQTGFFSTLDALVEDAPFEKAPFEQWKNYLKPGRVLEREGVRFPLKKEELDYTFEHPFTKDPNGNYYVPPNWTMTKGDLRKWIRDLRPDLALKVGVDNPLTNLSQALRDRFPAEEIQSNRRPPTLVPSRYRDWAFPTGPRGYEESALLSPAHFGMYPTHFGADVLSHSRTTLQPTSDEKRMRLVEEIQSDRHQAAAEKYTQNRDPYSQDSDFFEGRRGYLTPEGAKERVDLQEELRKLQNALRLRRPNPGDVTESLVWDDRYQRAQEISRRLKESDDLPPDAPFKDPADYAAFELRNQLLNAAKQGQDYLGLVRGADVSNRFSHRDDAREGTAYTYDKVYRSVLDKLARQYGTEVKNVDSHLKDVIDTATPSMRNMDAETVADYVDINRLHIDDSSGEDLESGFRNLSMLLNELATVNSQGTLKARKTLSQIRDIYKQHVENPTNAPESSQLIDLLWNNFSQKVSTLHDQYAENVRKKAGRSLIEGKTFPSMVLTPEIREKVLKAGVPIWSLSGAALTGLGANQLPSLTDDEETPGFAEGGSTLDTLRDWADQVGRGDEETTGNARRILSSFASQWYGMNEKSGQPEFLGGDYIGYLPGVASWRRAHGEPEYHTKGPGLLDELRSMAFGTDVGSEADERLTTLKNKVRERMGATEPHGLKQEMGDALGTMLGQLPVPTPSKANAAANVAQKLALRERLARMAKGLPKSAVEWFSPVVDPALKNYLMGTLFGGGIGAVGDSLEESAREESQGESFLESWNENNAMPAGWEREFAEGGAVKETEPLRSMLSELRSRLEELNSGLPEATPRASIEAPIMEEPMRKAKGGKVKTLLELRESLMRNLDSPNVEGTGRELVPEDKQRLNEISRVFPREEVPQYSTPESLVDLVSKPLPDVPSAPLQISRRQAIQGLASLMSPVKVPLSAKDLVIKQLTNAMEPEYEFGVGPDQMPQKPYVTPVLEGSDETFDLLQDAHDYWYEMSDEPHYPTVFAALERMPGSESLLQKMKSYRDSAGDWDEATHERAVKEIDAEFDALKKRNNFAPEDSEEYLDDLDEHEASKALESPEMKAHLEKMIDILNTSDPKDARKYVENLAGKLSNREYNALHNELDELLEEEGIGAIEIDEDDLDWEETK